MREAGKRRKWTSIEEEKMRKIRKAVWRADILAKRERGNWG